MRLLLRYISGPEQQKAAGKGGQIVIEFRNHMDYFVPHDLDNHLSRKVPQDEDLGRRALFQIDHRAGKIFSISISKDESDCRGRHALEVFKRLFDSSTCKRAVSRTAVAHSSGHLEAPVFSQKAIRESWFPAIISLRYGICAVEQSPHTVKAPPVGGGILGVVLTARTISFLLPANGALALQSLMKLVCCFSLAPKPSNPAGKSSRHVPSSHRMQDRWRLVDFIHLSR